MIVLADPTVSGSLMAWLLDVAHAAGIDRFALVVGPPASDGTYERAIEFSLPSHWPNADAQPHSVLVDIAWTGIMVAHHDGTIFTWQPTLARDGREWTELESRTAPHVDDAATTRTLALVIGETTPLSDIVAAFTAARAGHRVLALQRPSEEAFGPSITREQIQANVRAQMDPIRQCYEAALLTHPTLNGRIAFRFAIVPGGTVSAIEVSESSIPECPERTPMTQCMAAAIGAWMFPHRGSGTVMVEYPFNFTPG